MDENRPVKQQRPTQNKHDTPQTIFLVIGMCFVCIMDNL